MGKSRLIGGRIQVGTLYIQTILHRFFMSECAFIFMFSFAARLSTTDVRPATAQPLKTTKSNNSTQPPSPASGAWGGSLYGSHSPLSRPFSAGPYQRSETFQVVGPPRSASNRSDVSAEPLIEAIKSELRRFKDDKH